MNDVRHSGSEEPAQVVRDPPWRHPTCHRHVKAVDDVSFDVQPNQVLGLAGESGSGKTTIGRSVLRLIEPTSGSVAFKGMELTRLNSGRPSQIPASSSDHLSGPVFIAGPTDDDRRDRGRAAAGARHCARPHGPPPARRKPVGERLDFQAFPSRRPGELSGGQRQRIGIARALAVNPEFIVADEPVASLDVFIQAQVINLLQDLKEQLHLSLLFISHDIAVMRHVADRIAVVYLGKIMEIGPAREICEAPRHPYTEALLSAVPNPDPRQRRLRIVLQGDIPSPADPPSGCVFRTRCRYALAACAETQPQLESVGPGHYKACLRNDVP